MFKALQGLTYTVPEHITVTPKAPPPENIQYAKEVQDAINEQIEHKRMLLLLNGDVEEHTPKEGETT
jgi:hypothetical protein